MPLETRSQTLERARRLDASDPLASFHARFHHPPDTLYFDGNSLGLLSRDAEASLLRALEQWKRLGVRGWLEADPPWVHYGERLGGRVAALVGARPDEVVVTGSTTLNLHHLIATLYRPSAARHVIVGNQIDFPSDLHAIQGQAVLRGYLPERSVRLAQSRDGRTIREEDLEAVLGPDTALLVSSAVLYRSGQRLDAARLTRAAHEAGALAIWDLSHAVGAVPLALSEWEADAAFWCHYKYLNAGPGAVGGLFLHRRHHGARPALPGWWGQTLERKFEMLAEHEPAPGAAALQIGTIPILASAPLWGALDLIEEAGIERIREKSVGLTSFLIECVEALEMERDLGVRVGTPREPARRGAHVALEIPAGGTALEAALQARGVVVDFRPPDVLRFTPSPLTTRYEDVWRAMSILDEELRGAGR